MYETVPVCMNSFLAYIIPAANLIFIGHLNDPNKIAGVGMGIIIMNACVMAPYWGFNSALETLVSHAYGSGRM